MSIFAVLVIGTLSQTFAADANKAAPAPAKIVTPAKPVAPAEIVIETNEPAVDPNAVILTINDTKITEGQLDKIVAPRMRQTAGRVPPAQMNQYKQQMRRQAMEYMIIDTMLIEKEKAKNITVSEEELDAKINQQIAQYNLSIDDFKLRLKERGGNYSEYKENMKKGVMHEKLLETEFVGKIKEPNTAEIKAYYDENAQQFAIPESFHAKYIFIRPADGNDPNKAKLDAKTKAQEFLAKIKGGAEFETVAKENSAHPSAKNGGDIDVTKSELATMPELEQAVSALKPGEISDVVETQTGCHIIKLVEHLDANIVSLENAKEKIVADLGDKQKQQIVMDYIQNLKAEAKVNFTNEADKFDLIAPKPAIAAPPVRRAETTATAPQVKADANAPKPATEAAVTTSDEKTDKKVDKKVNKKAKKVKKKVDKKK
jgi:parvulin-like peptidyl-prolyl isomerase